MSALLVDDLVAPNAIAPQPTRWAHVERAALLGSEQVHCDSAPAPAAQMSPAHPQPVEGTVARDRGWQLTERGIAVAVVLFLAVLAAAAVVLVGAFLSVSDTPPTAPAASVGSMG